MEIIESSNLWRKNLAAQEQPDPLSKARDRFRQAFIKTRSAVEPLVNEISSELPDLTLHDITHLDHLWHVADTLIGEDFDINPAETFVLGIAILLHDAACSSVAYPKGISELCNTWEWKDFVTQKGFSDEVMRKGNYEYQITLFETLRLLHPRQAEKLLTQYWTKPNGDRCYLMEDVELRNHYGQLIGRIASSHGEDAVFVEREWANRSLYTQHSSLQLPRDVDWRVDFLKIAMLLRCIDAAHIDSRRAPDMAFSLRNPTGESKKHWDFQNHLGSIAIDEQNKLYWSAQPFDEKDSDAWWLCYNTAKMIDREICTANRILATNDRKELRAKGVAGAHDIPAFLQNVPAQGWYPVDVSFQIKDVGQVIEKFGGTKLYGNKPYLALKELIQNAVDAIHALRCYYNEEKMGERIDISLTEENDKWWLHVQDNGIGMSRYVLTDVLLDFGRSLWRDSSLREEWPSLSGKGFKSVGQFGIGFFSLFMLGDEIKVTTWRYRDDYTKQCTLHLRQRTYSRPILLDAHEELRLSEYGTRISVQLKNGRSSLLSNISTDGASSFFTNPHSRTREMTLAEIVGILAPALDIDVWCQDSLNKKTKIIEANDWKRLQPLELLRRLAPIYSENELKRHIHGFSDLVEENGEIVGRANITKSHLGGLGLDIGVFVHQGISVGRFNMCGILLSGNNEDLARSNAKPICSAYALKNWGQKIYNEIKDQTGPSPSQSHILISLGFPAENLLIAQMADHFVTESDIYNYLLKVSNSKEILLLLEQPDCPSTIPLDDFNYKFEYFNNVIVINRYNTLREDFGLGEWINSLIPDDDDHPRNIQAAIIRCAKRAGLNIDEIAHERAVGSIDNVKINANCLVFKKSN